MYLEMIVVSSDVGWEQSSEIYLFANLFRFHQSQLSIRKVARTRDSPSEMHFIESVESVQSAPGGKDPVSCTASRAEHVVKEWTYTTLDGLPIFQNLTTAPSMTNPNRTRVSPF